ncbi:hypothetical protein FRC06_011576 [Ceratobasidium sp. 370]|nr:hypothetical protein FRC06_011576 [Ceratobasidium sp. 370]
MATHVQSRVHLLRAEREQLRVQITTQREEEENAVLLAQSSTLNDENHSPSQEDLDMAADVDSALDLDPAPAREPFPPPPDILDTLGNPFEDHASHYAFDPDSFIMPGSFDSPESFPSTEQLPSATGRCSADPAWGPYPDRAHILTHSLFNAPHIRFSSGQQQAVLDWAKAMGTLDVPTMYSLQKCDDALKQTIGDPSSPFNSINHEFSNPSVRVHMHLYPEDAGDHSSETWHGDKLVQGHNRQQLTPMVTHENKTYFVDEFCELADGSAFVPDMFLRREGEMWARGCHFTKDTFGSSTDAYRRGTERVLKPLSEFRRTCVELLATYPNGVHIQDSEQREVLARPYMLFLPADNPMQAEECSSTGLRSNVFCRTCKVGGPQKHKQSDEGYSELFHESELRAAQDTKALVEQQYEIAFTSTSAATLAAFQRNHGVKDSIAQPILERIVKRRWEIQKSNRHMPMIDITKQLRHEFADVTSHPMMNPLLEVEGLDIHLDTPTEILHTLLLGITKYLWVEAVHAMDKSKQFDLFCTRLRSVSVAGINSDRPIPSYICTNRGSLNGKHFKILVQTIAFCLYDLVPDALRTAWSSLSKLTVLAWYSSIDNLPAYMAELDDSVQVLLHDLAKCSPHLLVDKGKTHLLVHMSLFVHRLGPLPGSSTERYESFNSVFRECSVHSNRQAPSRDIAAQFAAFDRTRHILGGGRWFDREANVWQSAGPHALALAETSPFLINILGGKIRSTQKPGTTVVRSNAPTVTWACTDISSFEHLLGLAPDLTMRPAVTLRTQCGDTASPGSHVAFAQLDDNPESPRMLGRIHKIWVPQNSDTPTSTPAYVLLHTFDWGLEDSTLGMPAVVLQDELVVTTVQNILGVINIQHRCAFAGCTDTGRVAIRQERQDTNVMRNAIQHQDDINFVVNTHSMHNYKLILELLHGRFNLRAQPGDPTANLETRKQGAQQVRLTRQKEDGAGKSTATEASSAPAAESSSARQKKRKRQEKPVAGASLHDATPGAGSSSATPHASGSTSIQRVYHAGDMYAPPVYPEALPFGWSPLNDELLNDSLFERQQDPQADAPDPAPNRLALSDPIIRRRPRSDSDSDTEETARLERRAQMEAYMDEYNIRGPTRERGQRFADLNPSQQIMFLFSYQLANQALANNSAANDFLNSPVYETHVVNRFKCALLQPWLSDYVTLWTEGLLDDMLRSPQAWRLPPEVVQQADQWQHFSSEIKMFRMHGQGADINKLARALAPRGMVIKEPHRARLAWIMLASVEFNQLVEQREISRTKFWEWIGTQVVALKKKIQDDARYSTDEERRTAVARVFTRALARHRDLFPPLAPVEPPQARPAWQETLEEALSLGAAI